MTSDECLFSMLKQLKTHLQKETEEGRMNVLARCLSIAMSRWILTMF